MSPLREFLLGLAEPASAAAYAKDPAQALSAAGLTAAERALMTSGQLQLIENALAAELACDARSHVDPSDSRSDLLIDAVLAAVQRESLSDADLPPALSLAEKCMLFAADEAVLTAMLQAAAAGCLQYRNLDAKALASTLVTIRPTPDPQPPVPKTRRRKARDAPGTRAKRKRPG